MRKPTTSKTQFENYVGQVLETLGKFAKRKYQETFQTWLEWCQQNKVNPLDIEPKTVNKFLISLKVSYGTRRRHLSALRRLAQEIVETNPEDAVAQTRYAQLLQVRVPTLDMQPSKSTQHELQPIQADQVLAVWDGEQPIQIRNRAIVALLFMTGLRRSEVAAVKREHLDLPNGTILIPHAEKPDRARTIAIPGEAALTALQGWLTRLPPGRAYLFPSIDKFGRLGPDLAMTDQAVYYIVQKTQAMSGLKFSPQDARRTFLTEALDNGSPISDVQIQAGHKEILSTLKYAKSPEATKRRERLKLRYGSTRTK
jgi:integrase